MNNIILFGGAGSLGRSFVARLHKDHDLTIWDSSEWAVAELRGIYPDCRFVLDDYANWRYDKDPADVIIILSAYKHVDLGEENPEAFIENNLTKLQAVLKEANFGGADILFVSSDKAVEPMGTYGFTKALGEKLVQHYGGSVARLGNILSSSGSVIPLWEEKINNKQPVPITDERMVRYWINDFEAADQIWDMYKAGKRLIIPQCKEIRLLDLLAEVLKRHGYKKASDYEPGVAEVGMRPGEKLRERLLWSHEEE